MDDLSLVDNVHSESITSARSDIHYEELSATRPTSKRSANKSLIRLEPLSRNNSKSNIDNSIKNEYPKLEAINQKNVSQDQDKENYLNRNEDNLNDNYEKEVSYVDLNNNFPELNEDNLIIDKGDYKIEVRSKSFIVDHIETQLENNDLDDENNLDAKSNENREEKTNYSNENNNDDSQRNQQSIEVSDQKNDKSNENTSIDENTYEINNQLLDSGKNQTKDQEETNNSIGAEILQQDKDLVKKAHQNHEESNNNEENDELERRFEQLTIENRLP
jgi:hypothetical protein